jgi:hypothetical protein
VTPQYARQQVAKICRYKSNNVRSAGVIGAAPAVKRGKTGPGNEFPGGTEIAVYHREQTGIEPF